MYFTFQKELRSSLNPDEITILKRKGWVQTIPPDYNQETHYPPMWKDGDWVEGDVLPPKEPTIVSMRSFRLALGSTLLSQLQAAIAAIPDAEAAFQANTILAYSTTVSRAHPMVTQFAAILNKSEVEVDAVFADAEILDQAA